MKEYITLAINMEIQAEHDSNPNPFPCTLNRSDSIITVRWLRKSNHNPEDAPIHSEVAGYHARNTPKRNTCNCSQYLPRRLNTVADCLL